jgi:hypothetical protein
LIRSKQPSFITLNPIYRITQFVQPAFIERLQFLELTLEVIHLGFCQRQALRPGLDGLRHVLQCPLIAFDDSLRIVFKREVQVSIGRAIILRFWS